MNRQKIKTNINCYKIFCCLLNILFTKDNKLQCKMIDFRKPISCDKNRPYIGIYIYVPIYTI